MGEFWIEVILILLLILANGFFACSEIAIISARKSRIRHLMDSGNKRAEVVNKLQSEPDKFLATVQIGITIVSMLAGAIGGATAIEEIKPLLQYAPIGVVSRWSEPISIALVVLVISYLSLILGELVPKSLALKFAEPIALSVGKPIHYLSRFSFILVRILTRSTNVFLKPFGRMPPPEGSFVTEEEIKIFLKEGGEKGIFEKSEQELIHSVFEFVTTTAKEIMVPRPKIKAIAIETLLKELQRRRMHMAIVINEYGNVEGLVTMEDVIEEIVGEIEDEYDFEDRPVKILKDGSMIIDASLQIRDLIDQYKLAIEESEDYETIAGLVLTQLQKMPRGGEIVKYGDYKITVVDIEGKRISKVKLEKVAGTPEVASEKMQNKFQ